jgi:hypothetical protein
VPDERDCDGTKASVEKAWMNAIRVVTRYVCRCSHEDETLILTAPDALDAFECRAVVEAPSRETSIEGAHGDFIRAISARRDEGFDPSRESGLDLDGRHDANVRFDHSRVNGTCACAA